MFVSTNYYQPNSARIRHRFGSNFKVIIWLQWSSCTCNYKSEIWHPVCMANVAWHMFIVTNCIDHIYPWLTRTKRSKCSRKLWYYYNWQITILFRLFPLDASVWPSHNWIDSPEKQQQQQKRRYKLSVILCLLANFAGFAFCDSLISRINTQQSNSVCVCQQDMTEGSCVCLFVHVDG